jgi:hypothetical protein
MDRTRVEIAAVVVGELAEVIRAAAVPGDDIKLKATDTRYSIHLCKLYILLSWKSVT